MTSVVDVDVVVGVIEHWVFIVILPTARRKIALRSRYSMVSTLRVKQTRYHATTALPNLFAYDICGKQTIPREFRVVPA